MFNRLIEMFCSFRKAIIKFMNSFLHAVAEFLLPVFHKCRRISHLAFHAKKARTRKKNVARLLDMFSYELKKRGVLWQK